VAIGAPTSLAGSVAKPGARVADTPVPAAPTPVKAAAPTAHVTVPAAAPARSVAAAAPAPAKAKLSFKEKRELAALPGVIEALEAEREALRIRTGGPDFYKETADAIRDALARLEAIDPELAAAYDRWNALEART